MESSSDKTWATQYLLDPLTAPEPSQEDGPGTSFRPGATVAPIKSNPSTSTKSSSIGRRLSKNNPYRKALDSPPLADVKRSVSLNSHQSVPSTHSRISSYPSPPPSGNTPNGKYPQTSITPRNLPHSPRSPDYRQAAFGDENKTPHSRSQSQSSSLTPPPHSNRRRTSSLGERFPGDRSHRPLDTLRREKYVADRSRHMTRKHHIQPDTIDNLDSSGLGPYHHGGPYDATLFARNNSINSPLAALADSNAEALKATPREKIIDSVEKHRPLDGVAAYASGDVDRNGNRYEYNEGENMMVDLAPGGGSYKRWPGVQYHPDDIKGKGEPSYSIEKALKDHSGDGKEGQQGIEMTSKAKANGNDAGSPPSAWDEGHTGFGRSGSISKRLSGGLKKRFGSLKKKNHNESGG